MSGEVAGWLASRRHTLQGTWLSLPSPLVSGPWVQHWFAESHGVSEAPLLPLLGTAWLGTSLGLSYVSPGLTLAAHLLQTCKAA